MQIFIIIYLHVIRENDIINVENVRVEWDTRASFYHNTTTSNSAFIFLTIMRENDARNTTQSKENIMRCILAPH